MLDWIPLAHSRIPVQQIDLVHTPAFRVRLSVLGWCGDMCLVFVEFSHKFPPKQMRESWWLGMIFAVSNIEIEILKCGLGCPSGLWLHTSHVARREHRILESSIPPYPTVNPHDLKSTHTTTMKQVSQSTTRISSEGNHHVCTMTST